jgi:hypothetical protein
MQQTDQAASIANCLLVPENIFLGAMTIVLWAFFVLLSAEVFVCLTHWEYKEQRIGWARNKGEEIWVVDTENVVECQLVGKTEIMYKRGHDFGVVLCGRVSGSNVH